MFTLYQFFGVLSYLAYNFWKPKHLANFLLAGVFIASILILFSDDYDETKTNKIIIRLSWFASMQVLLFFALSFSREQVNKNIKLILGSEQILYSWSLNSVANE